MAGIKVVSFDMEGTLIDHNFSNLIWETDIPILYGRKYGLSLDEARRKVTEEYQQVGQERLEWYDVGYWFSRFGLPGDWRELPEKRRDDCRVYMDTRPVLESLGKGYSIVILSNTIREFLEVQLEKLPDLFSYVFSATSDLGIVKKSGDFYRRVLQSTGIQPGEFVHVGDSLKFDYEAPKQLGLHAFHLDRSGKSEGEHVVHDLFEFEDKLRQLE